jgi:serine/threonine protein kinase
MIGSGAFGKVFIGLNEETGEFIAVKQVKFSDMAELRAFRQEINLMSSLNHENIVRYVENAISPYHGNIACQDYP